MASNTLQYHVFIEKNIEIKDGGKIFQNNHQNTGISNSGNKVISALVVFEKGDSLNARFTLELTSYDNYDNNSRRNKINTSYIQFIS
ncbi:MAG: hypothetical protein WCA39_05700 [Nitrososphaeraceae archaeon]